MNNSINDKRNFSSKSVEKIQKKNLYENINKITFHFYDDSNIKKNSKNIYTNEDLNDSQENEDTSISKNSKELNTSEKNENENSCLIYITNENSL